MPTIDNNFADVLASICSFSFWDLTAFFSYMQINMFQNNVISKMKIGNIKLSILLPHLSVFPAKSWCIGIVSGIN